MATQPRAWWNLFNQLETLAVQAWDGLAEIYKRIKANYAAALEKHTSIHQTNVAYVLLYIYVSIKGVWDFEQDIFLFLKLIPLNTTVRHNL